jgi:N-acetylneuraminate synthase
MADLRIGGRQVGDAEPCYIIGEIGINHNGDLEIAKKLIDLAAHTGCDAVKFQKRTPASRRTSGTLSATRHGGQ